MLLEVACPVGREPAWTTVLTQLQRAFEVPEFHPEPGERRKRVDDQPTAVTGDVIVLVGIRLRLNRTVDIDRVSDPLVLPPSVGLVSLGPGRSVAEPSASERLLHHKWVARSNPFTLRGGLGL